MSVGEEQDELGLSRMLVEHLVRTDVAIGDVAASLLGAVRGADARHALLTLLAALVRCGGPEEVCAAPLAPAQELLACYLLWRVAQEARAPEAAARALLDVCDGAFARARATRPCASSCSTSSRRARPRPRRSARTSSPRASSAPAPRAPTPTSAPSAPTPSRTARAPPPRPS